MAISDPKGTKILSVLVDAVQWDDDGRYQGGVSAQGDRTLELTNFFQKAIAATKAANPLSGEPEKMAD